MEQASSESHSWLSSDGALVHPCHAFCLVEPTTGQMSERCQNHKQWVRILLCWAVWHLCLSTAGSLDQDLSRAS
jgi:hypothetical protein